VFILGLLLNVIVIQDAMDYGGESLLLGYIAWGTIYVGVFIAILTPIVYTIAYAYDKIKYRFGL